MLDKILEGGANMIGNEYKRDAARDAIRAQQRGIEEAREMGGKYYDRALDRSEDQYGEGAETYSQDLANWRKLMGVAPAELGDFDGTLNVASFLDPAVDYRQKQAADAISQSAANAGGMFSGSGATAKALQDRSQDIASDEWGKAYNRADSAMKSKYSRFKDKFDASRSGQKIQRDNVGNLFKQSSGDRNNLFSGRNQADSGRTNLDMTSVRQDAGLEGDLNDMLGDYTANQWNLGGKMAGGIARESEDALKNYFSGGLSGLAPSTDGGNI